MDYIKQYLDHLEIPYDLLTMFSLRRFTLPAYCAVNEELKGKRKLMANWEKILSRGNVEDRRGFAPVVGGVGLGTAALLFVVNYLSGGSVLDFIYQLQTVPISIEQQQVANPAFEGHDEYEVFAAAVLGSANDLWQSEFGRLNQTYREPRLVLFRTATESRCGIASSDVGPHYCPTDESIYLDETFFQELVYRFGAQGGDVAEAYVIAHEVGHHVQNQLGVLDTLHQGGRSKADANAHSIQVELQADCFAGMWANSIRDQAVFEPDEVREAIDAAAAVGDDRIQQTVTGYVNPESWTHGSAEQRVQWFMRGYDEGSLEACNTLRLVP